MISGERYAEQESFEGHASAVVMVTAVDARAAYPYEFRMECLALDSSLEPFSVGVFIWDRRGAQWCQEYYYSTFAIGTCWRVSGRIDRYNGAIAFIDPVYKPSDGRAADVLRAHADQPARVDQEQPEEEVYSSFGNGET